MSSPPSASEAVRPLPWPAAEATVCVYGHHGAMAPVTERLQEAGLPVSCLATQTAPGTSLSAEETALAEEGLFESPHALGERLDLPVHHLPRPTTDDGATAVAALRHHGVRLVISLSAPILPPPFLDAFDGWVFNFHGSREYRGRAGLSWNLLNGLSQDAVVLHWIDPGIDTGQWIDSEPYDWPDDAVPLDLMRAQRPCFARLAGRLAARLAEGHIESHDPPPRPYLPALRTPIHGWIDWGWDANQVARAIRAFGPPYAGASTRILPHAAPGPGTEDPGRRLHLGQAAADPSAAALHPLAAGAVLAARPGKEARIACGRGVLHLRTVRDGDGEVPAGDAVRVGQRLGGQA